MTIFGFNTDVRVGDLVYHVESQARQSDLLLQTAVFVKGQCVGTHAVSYAEKTMQPDFSTQAMHEVLKMQHKSVIDAIQQGNVKEILGSGEIQDVGGSGLALKWIKTVPASDGSSITLIFQILDSAKPVSGAEVAISPYSSSDAPVVARAVSDDSGAVVLPVPLNEEIQRESAVLVRANLGGKSATRKFRFKI